MISYVSDHVLCKEGQFYFFLPIMYAFFFSCFIAPVRICITVLN